MGGEIHQNLQIAYIGGGSKGWAWGLMGDLALEEELSGTVRLYDIDFTSAKQNEVIGNRITASPGSKGKWTYRAVETLQQALDNAQFVVISILPGTFQEMYSDVHLPERYGIYQSVGDTTGPGGLMRALRTIPMYVDIARAIERFAPDAWVINYTNPMSLCVRTLYEVFPAIKAIGCCHGVFEVQELLVEVLRDLEGIEGVPRSGIYTNVLGINHFTWIDQASYRGHNLVPLYKRFVDKYYESGHELGEPGECEKNFFACANRVQFDMFRRYGVIVGPGDRHVAEFVPWYLTNPETVRSWKFGLTPVDWRIKHKRELEAKGAKFASGEIPPEVKPSGEEGLLQMKALLGLGDMVTNVNLPNVGQMLGVPHGAVVETNAVISRDSVKPVFAGKLPLDVEALVIRHVLNQETILQASLTQDRELAFRAFLNDPLVTTDISSARDLFDQMVSHTAQYLPGW